MDIPNTAGGLTGRESVNTISFHFSSVKQELLAEHDSSGTS